MALSALAQAVEATELSKSPWEAWSTGGGGLGRGRGSSSSSTTTCSVFPRPSAPLLFSGALLVVIIMPLVSHPITENKKNGQEEEHHGPTGPHPHPHPRIW